MHLDREKALRLIREPNRYLFKGEEKNFENYIIANLEDICSKLGLAPIRNIEQQHVIILESYKIIPDIMVWHTDGTGTVFEIKVSNDKNPQTSPNEQVKAIGQLLLYRNVIEERYGATLRVFMVTDQLFSKTVQIFANNNLPIGLIEIQNDRILSI